MLLRKLISLAPRERVPRHRLITNLIAQGDYDSANAEIRMFENEFNADGPVQRYKIRLAMERAQNSEGLTVEDKSQILRQAENLAQEGVRKFLNDTNLIKVYLDLGILLYDTVGATDIFDQAMTSANAVYKRLLDPDLLRTINHFQQIGERFKLSVQ